MIYFVKLFNYFINKTIRGCDIMNQRKLKEKLSNEFANLLRQLINSVDELDEYGDIENLFSSSLWLKAFYVRDRAEEILKENGLKI